MKYCYLLSTKTEISFNDKPVFDIHGNSLPMDAYVSLNGVQQKEWLEDFSFNSNAIVASWIKTPKTTKEITKEDRVFE